jgi:hypothetical protein
MPKAGLTSGAYAKSQDSSNKNPTQVGNKKSTLIVVLI